MQFLKGLILLLVLLVVCYGASGNIAGASVSARGSDYSSPKLPNASATYIIKQEGCAQATLEHTQTIILNCVKAAQSTQVANSFSKNSKKQHLTFLSRQSTVVTGICMRTGAGVIILRPAVAPRYLLNRVWII